MKNDRKLKVGLVFDDSLDSSDGVAQYVKTLGGWLSDQGHQVVYLAGETTKKSWGGAPIYSLARNLTVRFNGNRLSMPLVSKRKQLKRVLDEGRFDVLHVMMPYSPLMAQRLILMAPKSTAVVGTFHILPSGWLSRIGSRGLRLALIFSLRRFDEIISVSPPAQAFARSAYGIDSAIIPNPVDLARFKKTNIEPKSSRVVFLGRLVKRKGCGQLIKAFAAMEADFPDGELVIAGDGPERRSLQRLSKQLKIDHKVAFLGHIDEKDKLGLLASAAIACFPALYGESFGIVLIEAMAAGTPVVLGGNNPGYASVLGERPELLLDAKNTPLFAKKLSEYLTDARRRKSIAAWQTASVKQYDIETVGRRIIRKYEAAIAIRRQKSHNNHHE